MNVPFGPWRPDQGLAGVAHARNVVPVVGGWASWRASQRIQGRLPITPPITGYGAFTDTTGNHYSLVGTPTGLFRWNTDGTVTPLTRLSGPYTGDASTLWRAAQWADTLYLANGADPLQKLVLGSGNPCIDVPDESDPSSPNGLTFKNGLVTCRNFLFGLNEVQTGGINYPAAVRWSGLFRPETWTPSPATQSDRQDIAGMGVVQGGTGGDYVTVLLERGVVRFDYRGPPLFFEMTVLSTGVGCDAPRSVVKVGDATYWHSREGFFVSTGGGIAPIGVGEIDTWFATNARTSALQTTMVASYLTGAQLVAWLFESVDAPTGKPDSMLLYSPVLKRWGIVRADLAMLGSVATPAQTLDDPAWADKPMDDPTFPQPDSDFWKGLPGQASGMDHSGFPVTFSGDPLPAEFDTAEIGDAFARLTLTRAVPMLDGGGSMTLRTLSREHAFDGNPRLGPERLLNRQGFIPLRDAGRRMRFRCNLTGPWQLFKGLDVS